MRKSIVSAAALALLLSACDLSSPRDTQNYALFDVLVSAQGQELSVAPTAVFFRSGRLNLPDSREMVETCANVPIAPDGGAGLQLQLINGGDSVLVESGLTHAYLFPTAEGVGVTYALPGTGAIVASANASITIATPGVTGGFPAMTHSTAALAVPTIGVVTVPASVSQDMIVTWDQPTNNAANKIEFVMDYTSIDNVDMRLVCVFNDDGQATVAAGMLAGIRESMQPPTFGEATRFRSSFTQVGGDAMVVVVRSPRSFDVEYAEVAVAGR